jgi:hypothetical protein
MSQLVVHLTPLLYRKKTEPSGVLVSQLKEQGEAYARVAYDICDVGTNDRCHGILILQACRIIEVLLTVTTNTVTKCIASHCSSACFTARGSEPV